jgi:hypothetical protein
MVLYTIIYDYIYIYDYNYIRTPFKVDMIKKKL